MTHATALRLQRLAGNRAAAGVLQRQPASVPEQAVATDESVLVRQWIAETGGNENALTDRLYFHRHPDADRGAGLQSGSPQAREWIEIRQTIVRPALAAPDTATEGPPAPSDGVVADAQPATDATPSPSADDGDLLQAALDAGEDLVRWALEGGQAVRDAVAGFLGVDREVIEAGDMQPPEVVVDVDLEPEAAERSGGSTYKDQRDNQSSHVAAGVSCSPTSFTMALIDVHGGDEQAVRRRTIELINERDGDTDHAQTEELVIELLQVVDWPTATSEKPQYFWSPTQWAEWAARTYGGRYYKDPNAQQYVASLYAGTGGDAAETYADLYTQQAWAPVIEALRAGAVATAQGAFTSSGHVVYVVDADDSGVTINDPYGLWIKGTSYQIKNGDRSVRALSAGDLEIVRRRATRNPRLLEVYESFQAQSPPPEAGFATWGERNFYSWEDVGTVRLGKWVSVLRSAG